jgi:hypothetical protein
VARAKQTSRADARRRYRQTAAAADDAFGDDDAGSSPTAATSATASGSARGGTAKPGLGSAFRNAYQAPHYRDDLRALPELLRGRWFLIGTGLSVLGFVLYVLVPSPITGLLITVVSLPIGGPTLPVFLVGFTAPRASYLLGAVLGLVNVVAAVLVSPLVPTLNPTGNVVDILVNGVLLGLPTAVLFASGAAWYHRFLNLSNPRFGQPRGQRGGRSKSAQKAAAQKAAARR